MLSDFKPLDYGTYGFRFKGEHQDRIAGIYSVGWEKKDEDTYDWNGLDRQEENIYIFQYTLSGHGKISVNEQTYSLKKGDAFFVKVPSDHRYYLPSASDHWEFIYFTSFGEEVERTLQQVTHKLGPVFNLDLHSPPISIIFETLKAVSNKKLNDAFTSSSLAFSFLMELRRFSLNLMDHKEWPESIVLAVAFIEKHYAEPITLDDIVNVSNLSKYHFTRLFHDYLKVTPIQYLRKVRINHSIHLLKNDSLTVDDIAERVGFSNGNYFGKVFRSAVGLPPGEFRNSKTFSPIDHLIGDQ